MADLIDRCDRALYLPEIAAPVVSELDLERRQADKGKLIQASRRTAASSPSRCRPYRPWLQKAMLDHRCGAVLGGIQRGVRGFYQIPGRWLSFGWCRRHRR